MYYTGIEGTHNVLVTKRRIYYVYRSHLIHLAVITSAQYTSDQYGMVRSDSRCRYRAPRYLQAGTVCIGVIIVWDTVCRWNLFNKLGQGRDLDMQTSEIDGTASCNQICNPFCVI